MHGLINRGLQSFVIDIYGSAKWHAVCKLSQLSYNRFETMLHYDDADTEKVIKAIVSLTNRSRDDMLEDFGTFLVSQHSSPVVRRLLRLGGENYIEFLHSLEDIQDRVQIALPDLELPLLRLKPLNKMQYELHYQSSKLGYGAIFLGLLRAMADDYGSLVIIFHQPRVVNRISRDIFTINILDCNETVSSNLSPNINNNESYYKLGVNELERLMPMCSLISGTGEIIFVGATLNKLLNQDNVVGKNIFEIFKFHRPYMIKTMKEFPLALKGKIVVNSCNHVLRRMPGVAINLPDDNYLINLSLGAGVFRTLNSVDLLAKDFAPTDLSINMIDMLEMQRQFLGASRGLNQDLTIAKAEAEQQALRDPLTGLGNRRSLDRYLRRTLATNGGQKFAILLLDLDYFKSINDKMGHVAGDYVLKKISHRLQQQIRSTDMVARLGGDEFIMVIQDFNDSKSLINFADRVINKVKRPIIFEGKPCKISASIGAMIVDAHQATDINQILNPPDIALYLSKLKGRGRVTLFNYTLDSYIGNRNLINL